MKELFLGVSITGASSTAILMDSNKKMLKKSNIKLPSKNSFHNNIAQSIEILHCIDYAIEICDKLNIHDEPVDKVKVKAGKGIGAIEVPRGTLWHEYTLNDKGLITDSNIITPTVQNLLNIQEDIRDFVPIIKNKKKK